MPDLHEQIILTDRQAVLLSRHGVVAVVAAPREALELAMTVEHQAQIALLLARF
jgi:ribulose-5-phosphate 4-epimerase/fuculose-1-phosphate aldolase